MKKSNNKSKHIGWENNKNIRLALIIILVIALGVLFGAVGYSLYKWNEYSSYRSKIISVHYVNTSVQITPHSVGLNGDKDSLKFGRTFPGGGGQRILILNSTKEAIVNITIVGDMAKFLSLDKNEFLVKPNTIYNVTFYLEVPEDTTVGNYTSIIQVLFIKP